MLDLMLYLSDGLSVLQHEGRSVCIPYTFIPSLTSRIYYLPPDGKA